MATTENQTSSNYDIDYKLQPKEGNAASNKYNLAYQVIWCRRGCLSDTKSPGKARLYLLEAAFPSFQDEVAAIYGPILMVTK